MNKMPRITRNNSYDSMSSSQIEDTSEEINDNIAVYHQSNEEKKG